MTSYVDTYRRTLLDMHIPDWDPEFLSKYDPAALAETYAAADIEGVLLYCKSHIGLNYWPAPVGAVHAMAKERDLVGELVAACRERGLMPAAYHSVVFDNWAVENHPDWRQVSAATELGQYNGTILGNRYGIACVNHPDYVAYEIEQITALVRRYEFGALWIDMVFWPVVCICAHCQRRAKDELGLETIPTTVDWSSAEWVAFQEARTRWLNEFWVKIRDAARGACPGIPIAHNLAPELVGWISGAMTDEISRDSFAAGDLYGGRDEQLVVSRLMQALSTENVGEFMTSRAPNLRAHTELRDEHEVLLAALGATSQHLAFLFIDAIDPVGSTQPGVYERIGEVFSKTKPFQAHLGGTPVSDVAVYYSPRSRMSVDDNGKSVADPSWMLPTDYQRAFFGACSALQAAHLAFGVVTPATRDRLSDYSVLVLPDVTRMSADEVEDVRQFVARGGRLYASGQASVADLKASASEEFALADVFGAKRGKAYESDMVYYQPTSDLVREALQPEPMLSWSPNMDYFAPPVPVHVNFLADVPEDAEVLATFNLPYAYPAPGNVEDHKFSSIHSSPPWEDSGQPALVRHAFGDGVAIYSAAPLEISGSHSGRGLFAAVVASLIAGTPRIKAEGPSQVWVTLFDQVDRDRMILSILNHNTDAEPGVLSRITVSVGAPSGYIVTGANHTDGTAVPHSVTADGGRLELENFVVEIFAQIEVKLEKKP